MSNLFEIDFFPQDVNFQELAAGMEFAVSELQIDISTGDGQWHLGLDKLKTDVHLNMAKLDTYDQKFEDHMETLSNDLSELDEETTFLQNQAYGGLGLATFFALLLIVEGISLCCFLKKRFATFMKV